MTGFRVPQLDERQGDGRQAACLVGREAEVKDLRVRGHGPNRPAGTSW